MRPAPIAVSHAASGMAAPRASVRRARGVGSDCALVAQAGADVITDTFTSGSAMAGNLIRRHGLPAYSVALVGSRPTPLMAAITKPVKATGTVGPAIYGSGTVRQRP